MIDCELHGWTEGVCTWCHDSRTTALENSNRELCELYHERGIKLDKVIAERDRLAELLASARAISEQRAEELLKWKRLIEAHGS